MGATHQRAETAMRCRLGGGRYYLVLLLNNIRLEVQLMAIKIERLDNCPPMPYLERIKVTKMGNIIQLQAMEKCNRHCYIQRLDKDTYLDKRTGEIKEICHITRREQDPRSLARSMRELREIINTNVTDTSHVRWVTLTYAENMTDAKRLYDDFRKFNQRFQYFLKNHSYSKAEYICCIEPQGRGAWHCHVLFIWEKKAPFIPNTVLERIWGHGFTKITALDNIDNVGLYISAYLSTTSLDEATETDIPVNDKAKSIVKNGKRYIKGARLALYPPNCRLYRTSRGIKKPEVAWMPPDKAMKQVEKGVLTYEKNVRITDTDTQFTTVISTTEFHMTRKN